MSLEKGPSSSESDVTSMKKGSSFEEEEELTLSLGLPGEGRRSSPPSTAGDIVVKCSAKRGFTEAIDLNLGNTGSTPRGHAADPHLNESAAAKPPPSKAQVVGWPPVRSSRKKAISESCKYVKVAVDGAPYLRKVNLQAYSNYQDLMNDLLNLFTCFTICNSSSGEGIKLVDEEKGIEYVPTYEDKDSDWMLVGDVPWKMFTESCKRIRLMKSSEAAVLAAQASPKCSSTN